MSGEHGIRQVAVIGAGAMGCLFAARFAQAGASVTLVDVDAARVTLIDRKGLSLSDNDGTHQITVRAALAENIAGPVDLVLFFTKSLHTAAAAYSVAHLAEFTPVALTLQNGLGNAELIAEVFGTDNVLLGTAHVPARLAPPNEVISEGFANVDFGGLTPAAHGRASAVADLFDRAGFSPTVRADADVAVWTKLAFNAALNPLALIARATNGEMNNQWARSIAHAVVAETVEAAGAAGISLDRQEITDTVDKALIEHAGHKASMLQDLEAGRPTEIEFINGAIARKAAQSGVATPVTETLSNLVRLIENKAGREA